MKVRLRLVLALLSIAAFALSCEDSTTADYSYTIFGTVTDSTSGDPIAGVRVLDECDSLHAVAVTDTMGHYIVPGFEVRFPARLHLGFEASGYESRCVPHSDAVWRLDGYLLDIQLAPRYCLVPLAVIDRWDDTDGDGLWDPGEPYDPVTTGYRVPDDIGLQITLKAGNPQATLADDIYYPVALPPLGDEPDPQTGGEWLRKWMQECAPYEVAVGDSLVLEPGNMIQVLTEELAARIALDPGAIWDDATDSVVNSAFAVSPRLLIVPLFDPSLPPMSGRNFVEVGQIAVIFLESSPGNASFTARFVGPR